jgi:DNA-directed RNA polymerase II subunit RPB2
MPNTSMEMMIKNATEGTVAKGTATEGNAKGTAEGKEQEIDQSIGMSKEMETHVWNTIESFFKTYGVVHQQIDSFNYFINRGIQEVIDEEADISLVPKEGSRYVVHFGPVTVLNPSVIEDDRNLKLVFPSEARNRDLNYDSAICCDITETFYENNVVVEELKHYRIAIGRTPIMLCSEKCNLSNMSKEEKIKKGECEFDNGGYFIIKGNERVLVSQLRGNHNTVIVLKQKQADKYDHIAEIRSMSEETGHSVQIRALISTDKTVVFSIPYIKEYIPVGILFKALNFTSEEEISHLIALDIEDEEKNKNVKKIIKSIVRDAHFVQDQEEALIYIGQYAMHAIPKEKRRAYAWQVVETELLPHMGISSTIKEKAIFLGHIIKKLLLTHLGLRQPDDRDNYSNKRIETAGILCTELFKTLYKRFINTLTLQLEKKKSKPEILSIISRVNNITLGLKHSFATGNWGAQKNAYIRTGVSQVMSRMTYGATLSHMRRIVIPIGKEGKNAKIRQIHSSQFGYICPAETPEGQTAGIVMNFSLLTRVTRKVPTIVVKEIIERNENLLRIVDVELENFGKMARVFLNGILLGLTEDPISFTDDIKMLRKTKQLDSEISVSYDMMDEEVRIYCDAGRGIRPFFTINQKDDNPSLNFTLSDSPNWDELVKKSVIEYIDNSELENAVVAMTPAKIPEWRNDYCEIHPSMLLGVMGGMIPFPDHSPSPRNCYQCSMGKQAIGMFALSYQHRTDTIVNVLDYPQKPMVSTKPSKFMGFNDMPSGINAIVAVMSYTGYNQEDSVILNQDSIERGLFTVTSYFTITETEKKGGMYTNEIICLPPKTTDGIKVGEPDYFKRKSGNYSFLNEQGIIREKMTVKRGDVIVGKVLVKTSKTGVETKTDCSLTIKPGEEGIIDKVRVTTTPSGYKMVKVVIRKQRIPEIGDKFASRAAQKGTTGAIYRREDMPFNIDGICPDIIINPHCIPSRMTMNQLMECVLGKVCAISGEYGDATPFTSSSTNNAADRICQALADAGMKAGKAGQTAYDRHGWETLYNGMTGEPVRCKVFMGPTYYQRLKHMVSDKIHSRAHGHVTTLTRQPLEGRSRDGGLRFGEMERDCQISHGCARFLKERLFDCSDAYQIPICNLCGMITTTFTDCSVCKTDKVTLCDLPYASKLLTQELMAMGIKISIESQNK